MIEVDRGEERRKHCIDHELPRKETLIYLSGTRAPLCMWKIHGKKYKSGGRLNFFLTFSSQFVQRESSFFILSEQFPQRMRADT
jgi:hypothetical protein